MDKASQSLLQNLAQTLYEVFGIHSNDLETAFLVKCAFKTLDLSGNEISTLIAEDFHILFRRCLLD